MIKDLIKIANELDRRGLTNEADDVDSVINNITEEPQVSSSKWANHPKLSEFIKEWKEDGRWAKDLDDYMEDRQMLLDSLNEGFVGPELPAGETPGALHPQRTPGPQ